MFIVRCSSFHSIVACLFESILVPNHWCKSAIKCFLLLLIRLWWFVIFVTFVVCIIWAWALHVFWTMTCHIYSGACHVFLWSMWWLAQACKVVVTPWDRCARCLPVIRRRCHVICLRVAFHHVIMCIGIIMFSKPASVRVPPVPSVVRSEPRHTCTRARHVRNIIL